MNHVSPSTPEHLEDAKFSDDERLESSSANKLASNTGDDTHIKPDTQLKTNYRPPYVEDCPEDSEGGDNEHWEPPSVNELIRDSGDDTHTEPNSRLKTNHQPPAVQDCAEDSEDGNNGQGSSSTSDQSSIYDKSTTEFKPVLKKFRLGPPPTYIPFPRDPRYGDPLTREALERAGKEPSLQNDYARTGDYARSDFATNGSAYSSWEDSEDSDSDDFGHHIPASPDNGFCTSGANGSSKPKNVRNTHSSYDRGHSGTSNLSTKATVAHCAACDASDGRRKPPAMLTCQQCRRICPRSVLRKIRCGHYHCVMCLQHAFGIILQRAISMALIRHRPGRPRFCCDVDMDPRLVPDVFDEQFKTKWHRVFDEFITVICPRQDCGNSLLCANPERGYWTAKSTTCTPCGTHICLMCKGYLHGPLEQCPRQTGSQAIYPEWNAYPPAEPMFPNITQNGTARHSPYPQPQAEPIFPNITQNDTARHSPYPQPQAEPVVPTVFDRVKYAPVVDISRLRRSSPARAPTPPPRAYVRGPTEHHRARNSQ